MRYILMVGILECEDLIREFIIGGILMVIFEWGDM